MFAVNAFYNAAQLTYNLVLCYISTYVYMYPLYLASLADHSLPHQRQGLVNALTDIYVVAFFWQCCNQVTDFCHMISYTLYTSNHCKVL